MQQRVEGRKILLHGNSRLVSIARKEENSQNTNSDVKKCLRAFNAIVFKIRHKHQKYKKKKENVILSRVLFPLSHTRKI